MGDTMREEIIRAAVAAMPHTNQLVAEDLIGGFTMHTEADDIVAIWQAAHEAGRQLGMEQARREPLSDADISRCYYQSFCGTDIPSTHEFARAIERAHGIPTPPAGDSDKT